MLIDNAYRHHDTQQHQPAGFHTAPLVEVTFGIKVLKTHTHSHSQIIAHPPTPASPAAAVVTTPLK